MGFFDKVKKAFGSDKKEDDKSQNMDENIVNDETIDKTDSAEILENDDMDEKEDMEFQDSEDTFENEDAADKIPNFRYLDELIHSGAKEIVLDCDIILSDDEESEYKMGIKLDVDNLLIDGQGYTIDACGKTRIFESSEYDITIKNITLKNGFCERNGGSIKIDKGKLTIIKSTLKGNAVKGKNKNGGAVYNDGASLEIIDCVLSENKSLNRSGGAIFNNDGELTITHSTFADNSSHLGGGAIGNTGNLKIKESTLKDNTSSYGGAIGNNGKVSIDQSAFINNLAKTNGGAMNNNGKITITESIFKDNNARNNGNDISNEVSSRIFCEQSLLKTLKIHNLGIIQELTCLKTGKKDFSYLDELIHSGVKEIVLDSDIILGDGEESEYEEGIKLYIDDLVIDGNGHAIDARSKTRIFEVLGRNILLKNITFESGNSESGGAILNRGEARLINCKFYNNKCIGNRSKGGAVCNEDSLTLENCKFRGNSSKSRGGAISNDFNLIIQESCLEDNYARVGACIWNNGQTEIVNSKILEIGFQHLKWDAIIYQRNADNILFIEHSEFYFDSLNLIYLEDGACVVNNSKFHANDALAIYNEKGNVKLSKLQFESDEKIIFNNDIIKIRKEDDIERLIESSEKAVIKYYGVPITSEIKGFTYLDNIIKDAIDRTSLERVEIFLDCDIVMQDSEQDFFEGGIELSYDNLIINGQNHTIDADNLSRMFYITGKQITLKNIKFKNGRGFENKKYYSKTGGVICACHDTSLKIYDCEFSSNNSDGHVSVIETLGGSLEVNNSYFEDNKIISTKLSGKDCILSNGSGCVSIKGCSFEKNISRDILYSESDNVFVRQCKLINLDGSEENLNGKKCVTNQSSLADLVFNHQNSNVREIAFNRIDDCSILQDIVSLTSDTIIRRKADERLNTD